MKFSVQLFLVAAALCGAGALADVARQESVLLFENRKVGVAVPPGLTCEIGKDETSLPRIRIADTKQTVSMDVVFLPDVENRFANARARKEQMFELFQEYVGSSTEKAMQFEELEPRVGAGTYCVFTDTNLVGKTSLPPGEYLHLTAGLKAWPGVVVVFRLFSNDTKSDEYQAVMKLLRESLEERAVPLK